MKDMKITPNAFFADPLRTRVCRGSLEVSKKLYDWLCPRGILSAQDLVESLRKLPSAWFRDWELSEKELRSLLARILWDLRLNLDRGALIKTVDTDLFAVSCGSGYVQSLVRCGDTWKFESKGSALEGELFESHGAAVAALAKIGMTPDDNSIYGPHISRIPKIMLKGEWFRP